MTRILTAAIAILVLGAAAVASLSTAGAQSEIDVRVNNARSDFPNGIVFNLTAATAGGLDEVRLIYRIAPDGVRASAVPQCTGEAVASCRFDLLASPRNLLIPGAQVTYFWQLTSGDLSEETAPQEVLYEDSRFEWRSLTDGNLTVWWYSGSEDEARGILTAGNETLAGIGALLETSVDFPVKIRYYATAADMQAAIISTSGAGVVTRGEVVYSDTAMVSADSAAGDITRHEVAHIVVREAVRGPFGVPDWLNEGTAVFAQNQPLGDQRSALEAAIRSGNVFSVRSISSASAGALGGTVSLFYGQSWSLVRYLIDTYGEAQFAQLFRTFKEGDTTAGALEATYGFDQDGLENEWRASVGLPPRAAPPPGDGVAEPDEPTPVADPAADSTGGDGAPAALIIAIVGVTAVLAGGLVVAGMLLARRGR
ncbi:MAG: hypothetical protein IIB23_01240 [Chloroflexi bacterium]|nr:hypothetical protein [Chloroflexota bacterium]